MQDVLVADGARAGVAEMEFFEELDGRLALHEGVEGDFQVAVFLTEFEGGFDQSGADAAAAPVVAYAESADFADVVLVVLDTDHADNFFGVFVGLGDPEMTALVGQVGALDVVHVQAGVVLGDFSAEQTFTI